MSEKIFVDGVFVKGVNTKFGEIVKQSIEVESFIAFARQHAKQSEKNGKWYLNTEILTSQGGGKYIALDTFEPNQQRQQQAPQAPPAPPQAYQAPPQAPPAPPAPQQDPPMPEGNCDCTGIDSDIPF